MCALLDEALPEREAQPGLYEGSAALLDVIVLDDDNACWLEGYVSAGSWDCWRQSVIVLTLRQLCGQRSDE